MNKIVGVEISREGNPGLWEKGASFTNTGNSTIITGQNGEKLYPLFIRGGDLSSTKHTLLPIKIGYHVIIISYGRDGIDINIYKIININFSSKKTTLENIESFLMYDVEEYKKEASNKFKIAIIAVIEKCFCYHCEETFCTI